MTELDEPVAALLHRAVLLVSDDPLRRRDVEVPPLGQRDERPLDRRRVHVDGDVETQRPDELTLHRHAFTSGAPREITSSVAPRRSRGLKGYLKFARAVSATRSCCAITQSPEYERLRSMRSSPTRDETRSARSWNREARGPRPEARELHEVTRSERRGDHRGRGGAFEEPQRGRGDLVVRGLSPTPRSARSMNQRVACQVGALVMGPDPRAWGDLPTAR